jgi:hypothetical protein
VNPTRGPFVAPRDVFVNTNPNWGHNENLFSHLPYKREEKGRWRGTFSCSPIWALSLFSFVG